MSADDAITGSAEGLSESKRRLIEQRLRRKPPAARAAPDGIPRRATTGPRRASAGERWIFLAHQASQGSAGSSSTSTFRVRGSIDLPLLEQAVNRVVARHEILRSTYRLNQSTVEVIVRERLHVRIETIQCDGLDDLESQAEALVGRPFDLEQGPLLRLYYLDAPGGGLLTLVIHDIVFDAWSRGLFWKETAAFYREAAYGESVALAEPAVQYGDFAEWQSEWLAAGGRLDEQLQYWKRTLARLDDPIRLPTDRPYPSRITDSGRLERARLGPDVVRRLRRLAAAENASPYMLLLTAFQILLHRYTGAADIVVGSPVANRRRKDTADMIGFFLSTVALRTTIDPARTARDTLRQVRQTVLDALENQDVSFDRVVEAVKPPRRPGRHPVFQVMFVYQQESEAAPELNLGGVELSPAYVETRRSKFDLTLFAAEAGEGMETILEYRADIFDSATMRRMLGHYARLLESIVLDPDRPVSALEFVTGEELVLLFERWQGQRTPFDGRPGILERIAERAASAPEVVAVASAGRTMTYGQLARESDSLARELIRLGARPNRPVAHFMERTPEAIAAILGILKAGAAYVPIDPDYPESRHRFIVHDSAIDICVTTSALLPRIAGLVRNTVLADRPRPPSDEGVTLPTRNAEQTAYVIYTSGSTGDPKGVVVSDRNLLHSTSARVRYYGKGPDRFLLVPSFSFDSSIAGIFWTIVEGATLVLPGVEDMRDPSRLAALIRDERVSDVLCIPALYKEVLRAGPHHLQLLARVIVAGESCPPQLVALHYEGLPGVPLFNEYGPTEVSVWATVHACTADDGHAATVPIGRPIPNAGAYVLDGLRRPLPVGLTGELFLGGGGLSKGYHGRAELTGERFVSCDLPVAGRTALYRTGDRARWRSDGELEFLGRDDDQIKLRGYRIEPGEIESTLEQHPQVERAVVVLSRTQGEGSQPVSERGLAAVAGQGPSNTTDATDRLVAYLVCRNGNEPPDAVELRRHLSERLPRFMVPSAFVPVDAFPLLPNGKVNRDALVQRRDMRTAGAALEHAANQVEAQLMRIWDDLIDVPDVGRHDNFFELGGHSLLLPRLIDRVQRDFGVTLPLGTIFQTPTLSGLAEVIQAGNPSHWRSLVGIRVNGQRQPLYMVHGLGGEIGYFYNLAEYLDRQQPVFGLQAPVEPFDDIKAMASHYLDEIRSHQPHGPYLVGGYCIGGCVAFEMAQQLVASGEAVSLLAIVDAAMPGPQSFARRLRRFARKKPREMLAVLRSRAQRLTARLAVGRSAVDDEIQTFYGVPHAFQAPAAKHYRARGRYAPRPYEGDVWLFRSENAEFDFDLGWGPLVRGTLEIRTVPGRHADVLKEPNLKETARQLAAAVDTVAAREM